MEMKERLIDAGKEVSGHVVIEAVCHILNSKKAMAVHKAVLKETDVILVMACGAGVQTVTELKKIPVVASYSFPRKLLL